MPLLKRLSGAEVHWGTRGAPTIQAASTPKPTARFYVDGDALNEAHRLFGHVLWQSQAVEDVLVHFVSLAAKAVPVAGGVGDPRSA